MVTLEKINIYKSYDGNSDMMAYVGSQAHKQIMTDDIWVLIRGFVGDLTLIKKGLAGDAYKKSIEEQLHKHCDGEETINELKRMAGLSDIK